MPCEALWAACLYERFYMNKVELSYFLSISMLFYFIILEWGLLENSNLLCLRINFQSSLLDAMWGKAIREHVIVLF